MASNNKAKRISNNEWETHHATIQCLYITEGKPLGTEGGVIEHMKKHYDFSARYINRRTIYLQRFILAASHNTSCSFGNGNGERS
jgi:hypothetical protein